MIYYKCSAYSYDVWGNKKDGFEVNDTFCISNELFISADVMEFDDKLIRHMKKIFNIKRNVRIGSIAVSGDDKMITFDYSPEGYPIGHLIVNDLIET